MPRLLAVVVLIFVVVVIVSRPEALLRAPNTPHARHRAGRTASRLEAGGPGAGRTACFIVPALQRGTPPRPLQRPVPTARRRRGAECIGAPQRSDEPAGAADTNTIPLPKHRALLRAPKTPCARHRAGHTASRLEAGGPGGGAPGHQAPPRRLGCGADSGARHLRLVKAISVKFHTS